jgi:predicted Rossmann fold nucleotide-binding protein DprA/Smf involved in DNA uptake
VATWYFLRRNALVATQAGATLVVETGSKGGTLDTVGHLRRLSRPWFVTDMPPEARRHDVHQSLIPTGGRAVPTEPSRPALKKLFRAADKGADLACASRSVPDLFEGVPV